jgi:hypothetical protein
MYHHLQNLSISYAKTLRKWHQNVQSHWQTIRQSNPSVFTPEWHRMWTFYLVSCMVAFEAKKLYLTQFVLTKKALMEMSYLPAPNDGTVRMEGASWCVRRRNVYDEYRTIHPSMDAHAPSDSVEGPAIACSVSTMACS